MQISSWTTRAALVASVLTLGAGGARAEEPAAVDAKAVAAELAALRSRVAELEKKENEDWLTERRAAEIRSVVEDVLKDSKAREKSAEGPDIGYNNGFYIQTPDKNFKLTVGGLVQVRYEFAQANAHGNRTFPGRDVGDDEVTPSDPGNSNGFAIRRGRINFSGHAFSPDITYRLEGDFYGSSTGSFTVTDAFVAYRWTDLLRLRAGAYKAPFAKAELSSDPGLTFMERPEVLSPFDPVRALGVSLYGDIVKDKWGYEVSANNGSRTNTLRAPDTVGVSSNLDNRMGFYARTQWAGAGKISDFAEEADLRKDTSEFVWLLGGAVGYESQNADNRAFPSPQTTTGLPGLSTDDSAGFLKSTPLNGDIFRATLDWSAKWQGLSVITGAYFQQINQNEGNLSSDSGTDISFGPYDRNKSSFFQHGYYAQASYFVIPKLELAARAGVLLTEGGPNIGEFYSLGANYYLYGNNVKLQSDVTFTPEAPYTDASTSLLQNTHDLIFRLQLQLKF